MNSNRIYTSKTAVFAAAAAIIGVGTAVYSFYRYKDRKMRDLIQELTRKLELGLKKHSKAAKSRVTLIEHISDWEKIRDEFIPYLSSNPVLGFDCEWVSPGSHLGIQTLGKISLIQLALDNGWCVLFRMNKLRVIPKDLHKILASKSVIKVVKN